MATIRNIGLVAQLRSEASSHVIRYRKGRIRQSGRGLVFWFRPETSSIAEVPMDDREMTLFVRGRSQDFQAVAVQGTIGWHVVDPERLANRIDFSIGLRNGKLQGEPIEKIEARIAGIASQAVLQYLGGKPVRAILDAGPEPLRGGLETVLAGDQSLAEIGVSAVSVRLTNLAPTSELERALQTPTFEALQQKADEATFSRRALAVEKERAIAENELATRTELARREKLLISEEARERAKPRRRSRRGARRRGDGGSGAHPPRRGGQGPGRGAARRDLPRPAARGSARPRRAETGGQARHDRACQRDARPPRRRDGRVSQAPSDGGGALGMAALTHRAVFVIRETDYEALIARHATSGQARFFLESRGQKLEDVVERHERFHAVLAQARASVPDEWRQALVRRADLDRFLFAPDDVIVAVGQDGLVANVAKYLGAQPVIGINPAPDLYDGILARIAVERLGALLPASVNGAATIERRTMVRAILDHGETLFALNEIFVGHRSHQSARYRIETADEAEDHSSSGLIVASGTGITGWARSIAEATHLTIPLGTEEAAVGYWVREPFPSVASTTRLRAGKLKDDGLLITSRMNDGGVVFADGIEQDFLPFGWGSQVRLSPADRTLNLAVG